MNTCNEIGLYIVENHYNLFSAPSSPPSHRCPSPSSVVPAASQPLHISSPAPLNRAPPGWPISNGLRCVVMDSSGTALGPLECRTDHVLNSPLHLGMRSYKLVPIKQFDELTACRIDRRIVYYKKQLRDKVRRVRLQAMTVDMPTRTTRKRQAKTIRSIHARSAHDKGKNMKTATAKVCCRKH